MASISFASESLMDPRIQVKLDKYQKCGNIISQTSYIYIYINVAKLVLGGIYSMILLFIYVTYTNNLTLCVRLE